MLLRWDNEHPGQTVRIPTPIPDWDGVGYVSVATPFTHVPDAGAPQTAVQELATIKTGDVVAAATFVAPNQLDGDLNWNGLVNLDDLEIFKGHFFQTGLWSSDINESGVVNLDDLDIFKSNFFQTTGFPLPPNNPLP